MNLSIHHIGYLVKKGQKAQASFLTLGYHTVQDWVRDDARGIDISFLEKDGVTIELVSPFREDSSVSGLMRRIKNSPYHICYVSESLEKDAAALRAQGYLPITEPAPAPACGGHPVQFFLHPAVGMVELVEGTFPWQGNAIAITRP